MKKLKIWDCKIGEVDKGKLPDGADAPIRQAVQKAYKEITGEDCLFCFSGWGGELDDIERNIVNEKLPAIDKE